MQRRNEQKNKNVPNSVTTIHLLIRNAHNLIQRAIFSLDQPKRGRREKEKTPSGIHVRERERRKKEEEEKEEKGYTQRGIIDKVTFVKASHETNRLDASGQNGLVY